MDELLAALRAAGEPTRLRVLHAIAQTELNVGELCAVLGQSQPRVSRHLKLLVDAGLLERTAEGTSAYFTLTEHPDRRALLDSVLRQIDTSSAPAIADRAAIDQVRAERADAARHYFDRIATDWDRIRPLHVADEDVEAAMLKLLEGEEIRRLVDIGTGTGRMLELFAPHVDRALGVDTSLAMLRGARSHLDDAEFSHCTVRLGDGADLDLEDGYADVVILHHVLHFVDDPGRMLEEAARISRPDGTVLIVDFAAHEVESLRDDFAHRHLGFDKAQLSLLCEHAGLRIDHIDSFRPSATLPVHLWRARSPSPLDDAHRSPT